MNANLSLQGRTALVTGGGTGIGRAIALEFADNGCDIAIVYNRSRDQALEAMEEIEARGRRAVAIQADVTREDQVAHAVAETVASLGKIDILLNNAGTMVERRLVEEMDLALWHQIMDVNATSVFLVSKHVIPVMKARKYGRIINMSSVAARNGGSLGAAAYAAAKGAIATFTKALAKELAAHGITVNAISPGVITTRFHDQYSSAEARRNFAGIIPLGREGRPEEVAGAAMLLASDYGSYITGEMIEVNGGLLMS